ncbi:hypothetical protein NQ318_023614 [Aromia moschata]|uniref:Uncharacterized protein n=1 Tax=Aromia moschata TaxID=1265417 RepID=A0AAV8YQ64_9CUCU|nr:hypothetical protein NQ318_023614 [Aromia moschata]
MLVHNASPINSKQKISKRGGGILNTLVSKIPELHIYKYQYCGPFTKLEKKTCERRSCKNSDLSDRHKADYELEQCAWERVKSKDASIGEKAAALLVTNAMKAKKEIRKGGFLPLLLPILGALGALGRGAAGIAKAVNDVKTSKQQLAEEQRHNLAMEKAATTGKGLKGKGLYLAPYRKGKGLYLAPYKKNSQ